MMSPVKDDLTGAALVRLMQLSFAEQEISLPDRGPKTRPNSPHASLTDKTALAEAVLAAHGPAALLKVGQSVQRMAFDPLGAALLAARNGPDLIARWNRLERYIHTRHPIIVRSVSETGALLDHRGAPEDPPSPAVDYVLAGVIAGLLAVAGCTDLCLAIGPDDEPSVVIAAGAVVDGAQPIAEQTGLWRLSWTPGTRQPGPAAALYAQPDQHLSKPSRTAIALVEGDLLVIWSLPRLARQLGQSPRTLQRRFAEDGLSLQGLRRASQIRHASLMLLSGPASLASIGFACGFSDSAHFTRAFRKATGMSPTEFRNSARTGANQG
ncbi:AraC family transcriptional regulator [Bosea sp. BIWAKO-01]|uniref:helix-turn-helix transcriptional regulator n=1 Tax=Bosea sp. BIWAKO-01 TaxID=506668 RepID=UPI000869106F|nr:AraC family transcriptional regulator [Bosea sp. BIWAKO-01]GAU86490.1 transcriptional regulator of AraC family [Bosea sp. BIWAKO-01]